MYAQYARRRPGAIIFCFIIYFFFSIAVGIGIQTLYFHNNNSDIYAKSFAEKPRNPRDQTPEYRDFNTPMCTRTPFTRCTRRLRRCCYYYY